MATFLTWQIDDNLCIRRDIYVGPMCVDLEGEVTQKQIAGRDCNAKGDAVPSLSWTQDKRFGSAFVGRRHMFWEISI